MIVYVTGSKGFLGTYVCKLLMLEGYHVFESQVNLQDFDGLVSELKKSQADYVLHFAACSYVAHKDTSEFYKTNLIGTKNLVDAISISLPNIRKIIITSSAAVYGNINFETLSEDMVPSPSNDYSISKYAMELYLRQWFDKLPILIVRPFNFTGIGQSTKFIIPKIVDHFKRKSHEIQLGNTSTFREYSDVRDVASYFISLIVSDARSDIINICNGNAVSINQVLDLCRNISRHEIIVYRDPNLYRTGEINKLCGSTTKMFSIYSLKAKFTLEDTLNWMLSSN